MKNTTIFGALDPELVEHVSRRAAVEKSGKLAGALAIASMPVAFGLVAKRAFAQGTALPAEIISVLNFALTLEYLEDEFYRTGLETGGLVPPLARPIFEPISAHETAHVALLSGAITSGGGTPVPKPTFDFTAGGVFDPFGDYQQFAALSQAFEDTGVRAYKGQAGALMSNDAILTTALRIHSVEARHASAVRRLRGEKGWITGNQNTLPPEAAAVYAGEEAGAGVTTAASAEAFDEPLTRADVEAIASLFIVA